MINATIKKLISELTSLTQPSIYKYLDQKEVATNSFYVLFEIQYDNRISNITIVLDLFPTDCKLSILGALDFNLWYHLETVCANLKIIQSKLNSQYP